MDKAGRAAAVQRAQDKQLKLGWRRLGLRLSPQAARDLEIVMSERGGSITEIISTLLREDVQAWEIANDVLQQSKR